MSDIVDPKKAAELSLKITFAAAKAYERILEEDNERLEKLLSDTNTYYAECIAEREDLKQEVAELKRAVKTAVFADSAELKDVKKENKRLRAENEKLRAELLHWKYEVPEMTDTIIARIMWDAYAVQAGGKTFDGKPLPTWEELGEERQACWLAAASAASAALKEMGDE